MSESNLEGGVNQNQTHSEKTGHGLVQRIKFGLRGFFERRKPITPEQDLQGQLFTELYRKRLREAQPEIEARKEQVEKEKAETEVRVFEALGKLREATDTLRPKQVPQEKIDAIVQRSKQQREEFASAQERKKQQRIQALRQQIQGLKEENDTAEGIKKQ